MSQYFSNFPKTKYDLYFDKQLTDVIDIFRIVKVKKEYRDDISFYTFYTIQDGERPDVVSTKLYGTPDYYWTFFMLNDHLVNVANDWPLSTSELHHKIDLKYAGEVLTTDDDISTKFNKGHLMEGLISGATGYLVDKDSDVGLLKLESITGTFIPNELVRDSITNEFCSITGQAQFKDVAHHYENANGDWVLKNTAGATPISNEEYELMLHEKRTQIKIIRPQYIQAISDQFIEQIQSEDA